MLTHKSAHRCTCPETAPAQRPCPGCAAYATAQQQRPLRQTARGRPSPHTAALLARVPLLLDWMGEDVSYSEMARRLGVTADVLYGFLVYRGLHVARPQGIGRPSPHTAPLLARLGVICAWIAEGVPYARMARRLGVSANVLYGFLRYRGLYVSRQPGAPAVRRQQL